MAVETKLLYSTQPQKLAFTGSLRCGDGGIGVDHCDTILRVHMHAQTYLGFSSDSMLNGCSQKKRHWHQVGNQTARVYVCFCSARILHNAAPSYLNEFVLVPAQRQGHCSQDLQSHLMCFGLEGQGLLLPSFAQLFRPAGAQKLLHHSLSFPVCIAVKAWRPSWIQQQLLNYLSVSIAAAHENFCKQLVVSNDSAVQGPVWRC